ncbi:MAG TPA: hypothetical protein VGK73_19155 [Polyangiaceae bacterium]
MIALGLIYDVASSRLREMPMPPVPKPPRYDGRLGRGNDGFTWMSEMTLRDLEWWENAKRTSAAAGGQYADRDAKTAATLGKWVEWRRLFPETIWSGTRGEDRATALPPQRDPPKHSWKDSNKKKSNDKPAPDPDSDGRGEEEESYGF